MEFRLDQNYFDYATGLKMTNSMSITGQKERNRNLRN